MRARKVAGIIACVVFLTVYCLLAMVLGASVVQYTPGVVQFIYFVAAGLAWLPVLMWLIRWMQRPPA